MVAGIRLFFYEKLGIDKTVFINLFYKIWLLFSSLISIFFVVKYLSDIEQGYYYTFFSLIALQVLFELGFSVVILQKTSHASAGVKNFAIDLALDCKDRNIQQLSSIFKFTVKWYAVISLLVVLLLIPSGYYFFFKAEATNDVIWKSPWFLLVLSTAGNLFKDSLFSFLDGCGRVRNVIKIRAVQSVFGNLVLWLSLYFGFSLFSIAYQNIVIFIIGIVMIIYNYRVFLINIFKVKSSFQINWKKDFFPLQSKIAISWLCGYFQFQLFNPLLFSICGPKVAGQMGVSLMIMSGITSISLAWIQPKSYNFGALVSQKKFPELNQLFTVTIKQIFGISVVFSIFLLTVIVFAFKYEMPYVERILSPTHFLFLLIATLSNIMTTSIAIYLRAFLEEPLLKVSLLNALCIASLAFLITPIFGVTGLVIVYSTCSLIIGFFGAFYIYKKKQSNLVENEAYYCNTNL